MPTAARLAGAIVFGVVALYLGLLAVNVFPNERPPSYWYPFVVVIGILVGWRFCGSRAGQGYSASVGLGITTALCLAFWVIFLVALERMVTNALDLEYDGVMNAILNIFIEMSEFAKELYNVNLIINLFISGIVGAVLVEIVARRLP